MAKDNQDQAFNDSYPEELSLAEKELLKISRSARNNPDDFSVRDCTGVGLSGGGIRSATFCLGVFQGLAGLKMLSSIDFMSTVSGGGYFGSFYARLFMRKEVPDFKYVEETLDPCPASEAGNAKEPYQINVINWLRENGRYLSPKGSGDLLLAGAVLLRNWLVVQMVLAILFLLIFLAAQLIRNLIDPWFQTVAFLKEPNTEWVMTLPGHLKLWVSPFLAIPVLLFIFWAVPTGWAYWMVGRQPPKMEFWKRPVTGLAFIALADLAAFVVLPPDSAVLAAAIGILIVTALTACWSYASWIYCSRAAKAGDLGTRAKYRDSYKNDLARNWVSGQLKTSLVITVAALAFAAVDSLGQTVYLVLLTPEATLKAWTGGVLGAIVALAPFATRIAISFGGANGGKRPKALTKIAAAAAAFLISATLCTTFNVGANAIAWTLQRPEQAPPDIGNPPLPKLSDSKIVPDKLQPNNWSIEIKQPHPVGMTAPYRNTAVLWAACGIAFVLSFLFGQSWPFLNRSTQMPLYSARLTRAYLGASNSRRFKAEGQDLAGGAITRVIPGDDIDIEHYWPWPPEDEKHAVPEKAKQQMYQKGTPLHLINVTINETLDGKSQVQQQDRKGIGMALGPAGISAGIRHHVVFDRLSDRIRTFPVGGFRMFNYGEEEGSRKFKGEMLPLGQWLGISGAAFSTGLGARTNLALSLLTGIGNIRLGYWWNSGIEPEKRANRQRPPFSQLLGSAFTRIFPVQSYLMDEFTARFHGSARKHWYLSDGGHFENMGGYELIRRRLRTIVIIDAEADPDYTFEGLAALIRKARTDFGAEITFLDDSQLDNVFPKDHEHCFSSLENLRRGKWVEEKLPDPDINGARRQTIDPVDHRRHSLAHAALARITYDCKEKPESCLIYLKPTLMGNEPLDVLQYHVENSSFPQETTLDQFFDEAQWESYRALGEHIARRVFKAPEGEDEKIWWASFVETVLQHY
jgi:hypothetical protein